MAKATDDHTPAADPFADNPLFAIEESLAELTGVAQLCGHLACSELAVEGAEMSVIQGIVLWAHYDIERRWKQAFEERGCAP
jgi:hypothetical protein